MDRDNWKYYLDINLSVIYMQKQEECVMRLNFIRIILDDISKVYFRISNKVLNQNKIIFIKIQYKFYGKKKIIKIKII